MIKPTKLICTIFRCNWHGTSDEALTAISPFDEDDEIWACPKCKTVDSLRLSCDEPECWMPVDCGTPTPDGYRHTCSKHQPKDKK